MRETTDVRADIEASVDASIAAYAEWSARHDPVGARVAVKRGIACAKALAALEPAPKPAGGEWVTVPREPTESMKERVRGHGGAQALAFAMAAWPDMLAAAPPAPAAIAERDERLSTARMIAEAAEDQRDAAKARASELQREVERKDKALIWYENNVAGCRLIHSGGDSHRAALAEDGGSRARAALQQEGESDV